MFFYEAHRFGLNDEFIVQTVNNMEFPIHLHRCFELLYIYEGQQDVSIDNEKVTLYKDEMVLIFPNQLHSYSSPIDCKGFMCIFSPEYVESFYQYCNNKKQENIMTHFSKETNELISKKLPLAGGNKYLIKACLYALCADIFAGTRLVEKKEFKGNMLLHKILSAIEENYTNDISLKDIAQRTGYDYQYISRYFNAQFKIPFSAFLNEYRINYATYLMNSSQKNITEIALSCGYSSNRSFNRNFIKILKKTPTQYRQELINPK